LSCVTICLKIADGILSGMTLKWAGCAAAKLVVSQRIAAQAERNQPVRAPTARSDRARLRLERSELRIVLLPTRRR